MAEAERKRYGWGWFLLVYAAPLAFWLLRAEAMVSTPRDLCTMIVGPLRLVRMDESFVPLIALPLIPLFAVRQHVVTGVLSAVATFAWGLMGVVVLAGPHA